MTNTGFLICAHTKREREKLTGCFIPLFSTPSESPSFHPILVSNWCPLLLELMGLEEEEEEREWERRKDTVSY